MGLLRNKRKLQKLWQNRQQLGVDAEASFLRRNGGRWDGGYGGNREFQVWWLLAGEAAAQGGGKLSPGSSIHLQGQVPLFRLGLQLTTSVSAPLAHPPTPFCEVSCD